MLTILIADDHPIVRRGTRDVLRERFTSVEVIEAEDGSAMIELAAGRSWDLCIMDINMPTQSGIDLLENLQRVLPDVPILVFSMYPEATYGVRMLRLGAKGYVNKASGPDGLLKAVETILAGHRYISPTLAECLAAALRPSAPALHECLSDREFEVLRRLVQGKPIKEIGSDLFVSPSTVSTHRRRLMEKLGIKNNAELSRYALKHSLDE